MKIMERHGCEQARIKRNSWCIPDDAGSTATDLEQNSNLNSTNWTTYAGTINSNAATMTAIIPLPAGNNFFRLVQQ